MPSQTTFEWADPTGSPTPDGLPAPSASGDAADGRPGAIERAPIPQDYRDHVRTYFGGGDR
ncbi:MAG TPA: hypothetical protein ENK57_19635 [Polyangiaceae bacterium]|nr:hypothetical protein [Polyangiaceae bacterium]